jgi:hypothetical protein
MRTYGQLIHVEEFHRDGVHYRVAVFRVQGGLHGKWSCDTCLIHEDEDAPTHPAIEECVAQTKKNIDRHHREHHAAE